MRDERRDPLGRSHGHRPAVDDVDVIAAGVLRQSGRPLVGLVFAQIDVADLAILGARDAAPRPRPRAAERRQSVADILLDDLAQEADALPGLAIELAALGPPDDVL